MNSSCHCERMFTLSASYVCFHMSCNRCEQQQHLPTTVNSMLSNSKAMKTMNRISLRDCLSSLSHVNKLKSLRASNSPIFIKSNCQRASQRSCNSKKTTVKNHQIMLIDSTLKTELKWMITNMREILVKIKQSFFNIN